MSPCEKTKETDDSDEAYENLSRRKEFIIISNSQTIGDIPAANVRKKCKAIWVSRDNMELHFNIIIQ